MPQHAATILKRARERTAEARERLAEEQLGWTAVMAAISEAAGRGLDRIELAAPANVNLEDTCVGRKLTARLHGGGFTVDWIERPPARPGEAVTFAMTVAW